MTTGIKRGKIKKVWLGEGGYQDAMFGFTFELGGKDWGVIDFWGTWANHSEYCKWSVEDQNKSFLGALIKVKNLLSESGAKGISNLVGKPIEATFLDNTLKSWRIMTEVL